MHFEDTYSLIQQLSEQWTNYARNITNVSKIIENSSSYNNSLMCLLFLADNENHIIYVSTPIPRDCITFNVLNNDIDTTTKVINLLHEADATNKTPVIKTDDNCGVVMYSSDVPVTYNELDLEGYTFVEVDVSSDVNENNQTPIDLFMLDLQMRSIYIKT